MRMNLVDKMNLFESMTFQNVGNFNKVFTDVQLEGLDNQLPVSIGELADTDTTRFLSVGSLIVKHNFTPVRIEDEFIGYTL
jgi:hypothetical protein